MNIKKKHSMNNNLVLRDRVDVDLLGNITSQSILHYLGDEEKKPEYKKKKKVIKKSTIQLELQSPLILAQCISLLPIYGASNPDFNKLELKWKSLKVLYTILVLLLIVVFCLFSIKRYVKDGGVTYSSIGDMVFYGSSLLTSIFFLKLVNDWKDLITKWTAVQDQMNNFESSDVQKEIKLLTICLVCSSIFEHILSNTQFMLIAAENDDRIRMFLYNNNIFDLTGYNTIFAIVTYILNCVITLIWNFPDIFLTSVSLSLANMFKQFHKDLDFDSKNISNIREVSITYWKRKREIYNSISLLTKTVEQRISLLVLLSFSNNVYFICIQLLNSLQPLKSFLQVAYFCGSFGHILLRTCSVCYSAASIYDNSKAPLSVLFSVPSEQYNCEVQRMITQLSTETLALTGCKFFTVTRTLMLTIAGTIITYEVVLVQFNGLSPDDSRQPPVLATADPAFNISSTFS